jgi:hypothetical protein
MFTKLTKIFLNKETVTLENFYFFHFAVQFCQKEYRGKTQICLVDENGYVYSLKQRIGEGRDWRCSRRTEFKCQAKCSTLNRRLKKVSGQHNHGPTFCEKTMKLLNDTELEYYSSSV